METTLRYRLLPALCLAATLLVGGLRDDASGPRRAEDRVDARSPSRRPRRWASASPRARRSIPDCPDSACSSDGADSFALRMQIAEKAEKTLDVQYFVLQQDETGQLLLGALLAAADRGVRVRILLDDALGIDGGAKIRPLSAHPNIEIRVFNPFVARQELDVPARRGVPARRSAGSTTGCTTSSSSATTRSPSRAGATSATSTSRRAPRSSSAISISRSPGRWCADLSRTFDLFWNDRLAIPVEAQPLGNPSLDDLEAARAALAEHKEKMATSVYLRHAFQGRSARRNAVGQTSARLGEGDARLRQSRQGVDAAAAISPGSSCGSGWRRRPSPSSRDLIIVSPYLVPGGSELELIAAVARARRARADPHQLARLDRHADRPRRLPELSGAAAARWASSSTKCAGSSGEPETQRGSIKSASSGAFALHAKVFVFDRERAFVGSMNFDRRSLRINTELGLIIDSPQDRARDRRALRCDHAAVRTATRWSWRRRARRRSRAPVARHRRAETP